MQDVRSCCGLKFRPIAHMDFRKLNGNTLRRNTLCAIYSATVYLMWRSRNDAVWNGFVRSPSRISVLVRDDVRHRFRSLHSMIVNDSIDGWLS